MDHTNGNRSSITGIIGGLAVGALAMYIFDPVQGNRRRALMRDKLHSMKVTAREAAEAKSRDLANRAQGLAAKARGAASGATEAVRPAAGEMSQSNSAP